MANDLYPLSLIPQTNRYIFQDLEVMPWEMAIDGPSSKMEQFLSRNYGIERLMRQNNNFAVAPGFFDRTDEEIKYLLYTE